MDKENKCRVGKTLLKYWYLSSKVVDTKVKNAALDFGVQGGPNILVELV